MQKKKSGLKLLATFDREGFLISPSKIE